MTTNSKSLHLAGKTQSDLCRDYGVSGSALSKWVRQFSEVKFEDNSVLTAKQIQELKKRNAQLACDTLQIAINTRRPTESIIFHSDQGSQFKSEEFRKLLDEYHLMPSYSNPGYPYDNAVTEVFFKYLKQREINRRTFHSIEELRLSCFE